MNARLPTALAAALCLAVLSAAPARATDYYVATNGFDISGNGTIENPWRTISWAVNGVDGGDRIWVRGGDYREEIVVTNTRGTASSPIRIWACTNETPTVKGADVVTNWQFHGGFIWKQTNWMINTGQVMDDGVVLRQIGWPNSWLQQEENRWIYTDTCYNAGFTLTDMTNGTFFCDTNSRTLYIWLADGSDPAGSVVEASTRRLLLDNSEHKSVLQIRGLAFRYCNTLAHTESGWPGIFLGHYGLMEDCDVQWCDMAGVSGGISSRLVRCELSNCGNLAGGGQFVDQCRMLSNNYRRISLGHQGGGTKYMLARDCVIENTEVAYNYGPGIWLDTCWTGGTAILRNNYVHDNIEGPGFFIEISRNVWLCNNLVVSNNPAQAGIVLSGSSDVRVFNNTVIGNRGIQLLGLPRSFCYDDGGTEQCFEAALTNNWIANNIFWNDLPIADLSTYAPGFTNYHGNVFERNCYFHAVPGASEFLGQLVYSGSSETFIIGLSRWREITGLESNSFCAAPRFAASAGSTAYSLAAYSPCVDAGTGMAWMVGATDFGTNARVLGAGVDLGAFEFNSSAGVGPVSAPASVAASDGTYADRVAVTWSTVSGAPGYQVARSPLNEPGVAVLVSGSIVTAASFDVSGSPFGVTNLYWVRAVDDAGLGPWSAADPGSSSTSSPDRLARWTFDEGAGAVAMDVVGGLTGTITGALWTNDAAPATGGRGSLFFHTNGASVVELGTNSLVMPADAITVSAWFKLLPGGYPSAPIVSCAFRQAPNPGVGYRIGRIAPETIAYLARFADGSEVSLEARIQYGQWQHAVLTYDRAAGFMRAYLNGAEAGWAAQTNGLVYDPAAVPVSVGRCAGAQMEGFVDEVRIYDRAITADEVRDLYRGLIAWLPLESGADDASGNRNHGVLYGPQPSSGVVGAAHAFLGPHDYVETPDNLDFRPLDALTVSAWFRMSAASSNNGTVLDCFEYASVPGSAGYAIHRDGSGERIAFAMGFESEADARFSAPIRYDHWHHAALTYGRDAGCVKAYVDGTEIGSLARTSSVSYNVSVRPAIGARNFGQTFRGAIDDVRVYRTALGAPDIAALFMDKDGDGLADATEVNEYPTDPCDTDSDDDALSDGDEVREYETDPLDGDSDDDEAPDGAEIIAGTDPRDGDAYFCADGNRLSQDGDAFVVQWQSVTGRLYTVSDSTNLAAPGWTSIPGAVLLEGTGSRMSVTNDTGDVNRRCYRIGVKRQ